MKVNKRNLIELILQCFIILLVFVPGFCTYTVGFLNGDILSYSLSMYFSRYRWLLLSGVFGVVLFVIQLVAKNNKRNFLPTAIVAVIESAYLLFPSTESYHSYGMSLGIVFYIMLVVFIALDVITVLGYIKAKKYGITDEPLFKIKKDEISSSEANIEYGEAYRSLAMHVFLFIITLGIWYLIWLYKTSKFLNKTPNSEQYSPAKKLLLCMFIPMYQTYWFYKHGAKVDAFCQYKGIQNSYLTIICALIPIPLVSSVIMQDKINQICTSK